MKLNGGLLKQITALLLHNKSEGEEIGSLVGERANQSPVITGLERI